jgi:hypothetical protein
MIIYASLSSLAIVTHLLALMISLCLLPHVAATMNDLQDIRHEEHIHVEQCRRGLPSERLLTPAYYEGVVALRQEQSRAGLSSLEKYVQLAWLLSSGVGSILFVLNLPFIAFLLVCSTRA